MNYEEARFRIINTQLNKLKSATTTTTTKKNWNNVTNN